MNTYAYLRVRQGMCNSNDLSEITFQYPLITQREHELHKKALEVITMDPFQQGHKYPWILVERSQHKAFLEACAIIPGGFSGPVTVPDHIKHAVIDFAEYLRFDGYSAADKDRLVQQIVETGIHPNPAALDFTFQFMRGVEAQFGQPNPEKLAREERAVFAGNLTFHTE
jgi:hypothetical protein